MGIFANRLLRYLGERGVGGTEEREGSYYMRGREQRGVTKYQLQELAAGSRVS